MKKGYFCLLLLMICISFQSCKNDCEDLLCFTPPPHFGFELVGKTTKENLFTNGTYDPVDIEVTNTDNGEAIECDFISENDYNMLLINSIGWETEQVNASIRIAGEEVFQLYVNAERMTADCCAYTKLEEVKIKNTEYTEDPENGIYTILVNKE